MAGGFIAGAICTPDYGRFLRNGTEVFWMTLIGTFVGELGMNLLAVLLAHATGTNNVVDMMMATSGVIGVLIVVAPPSSSMTSTCIHHPLACPR